MHDRGNTRVSNDGVRTGQRVGQPDDPYDRHEPPEVRAEPDVVKQSGNVQQFWIEAEPSVTPLQAGEEVDPA